MEENLNRVFSDRRKLKKKEPSYMSLARKIVITSLINFCCEENARKRYKEKSIPIGRWKRDSILYVLKIWTPLDTYFYLYFHKKEAERKRKQLCHYHALVFDGLKKSKEVSGIFKKIDYKIISEIYPVNIDEGNLLKGVSKEE